MAYYVPVLPQQIITPGIAAAVPLPPSPFGSPYTTPYGSPYASPNAVLVPLPSSPMIPVIASLPGTPASNPLPLPPAPNPPMTLATDFLCHPLLAFDPYNPKLIWDVRSPPEMARTNKPQPRLLQNLGHLNEHAMSPPWTFIRIRCSLLPWIIEYDNLAGIKVGDIFDVLYDFLRERVSRSDWKDESPEFQDKLIDTWRRRCAREGEIRGRRYRLEEENAGIRRVDWLLWDHEFLGLEYVGQSEPETWVVHFRSK